MTALDPNHVTFEKRVVPDDADHDYGFWGSYTFDDETGRNHTVERLFKIYADPNGRENGDPVAVIEETHLVAQEPQEERRAGDAEQVDTTVHERVVDVDDAPEESAVMQWCEDWHEARLERPAE